MKFSSIAINSLQQVLHPIFQTQRYFIPFTLFLKEYLNP